MQVTTLGIDLAEQGSQLHGVDQARESSSA